MIKQNLNIRFSKASTLNFLNTLDIHKTRNTSCFDIIPLRRLFTQLSNNDSKTQESYKLIPSDKVETQSEKILQGIFTLVLLDYKVNPKAYFIYFDVPTSTITNFEMYSGKSHYKNFTTFVSKTIIKNQIPQNTVLLAPKYYINESLINRWKNILGVTIEGYNSKDIISQIKIIKKAIKDINNKDLEKIINNLNDYFNSETNNINNASLNSNRGVVRNFHSKQPWKSINNNQRRYSTLRDVTINTIKHKWSSFTFKTLEHKWLLDSITIKACLNKFWDDVVKEALKDNKKLKISLQFKIAFECGNIRSISPLDTVTIKDLKNVIEAYTALWAAKQGGYKDLKVKEMILFYKIQPEDYKGNFHSFQDFKEISEVNNTKSFTKSQFHSQLPNNMDIKSWGDYTYREIKRLYNISIKNTKLIANVIPQLGDKPQNLVFILIKQFSGLHNLTNFVDQSGENPKDLYTFKRIFDNITIYFNKGVQNLFLETKKVSFIEKLSSQKPPKSKIITADLETKEVLEGENKKLEPVCISLAITPQDGSIDPIRKSFGIWDYDSPEEMILAAFKTILVRKYSGYSVYFHNFSYFDGIFLTKTLVNIPDIKVNIDNREGRLLKVNIQYNKRNKIPKSGSKYQSSINIYDSFLLLPTSLEKLAKIFGKNVNKGFFPLKILNDLSISLSYEGEVPQLKYFYHPHPLNITAYNKYLVRYDNFKKSFVNTDTGEIRKWNLKKELINYCEQDVISLYNVINTFATEIYDKFEINILKYPTLPSIAFAIFRSKFMSNENIPIIGGAIYNDIKAAYYGGFVDVYKPFGRFIKSYDINSLYPFAMWFYPMPVGTPTYFEGDSSKIDNLFGFVYAKVVSPDIKTPILPYRAKINGVTVTRYPVGSWSGWYFTEELKNASKYGYKYEIIKGYNFEKSIIFKEYVTTLYNIKSSVSSDSPWYTISKLLLNSLYGRFGMSPHIEENDIIDLEYLDVLNQKSGTTIIDSKILGNKCWVTYKTVKTDEKELINISVPIAAAITSWSRIHMSSYIMNNSEYICAIDTDGVKLTRELDPSLIGVELGKMKDEGSFKEGVFIAPKVYGLIDDVANAIVKVKGLKEPISYWKLKTLLSVKNLKIQQDKWYRNISESTIDIINQIYTLAATEDKRELIFDSCGKIVGTLPYLVKNGEIIKREIFILHYLISPVNWQLPPPPIFYLLSPPTDVIIYLPAPLPDVIYLPIPSFMPIPLPSPCLSLTLIEPL